MDLELQPLNLPSDNPRPFVIAGPCSAETEEQVITTAKQLKQLGCHMFRAGIWKPRTKPKPVMPMTQMHAMQMGEMVWA